MDVQETDGGHIISTFGCFTVTYEEMILGEEETTWSCLQPDQFFPREMHSHFSPSIVFSGAGGVVGS